MPLSIRSGLEWVLRVFGFKMKKRALMVDVIVCGVQADEVIEDLAKLVPKSVATHITAENANKSKDLWRLISQSRLIRLNINPLLRTPQAQPSSASEVTTEVLSTEYVRVVAEAAKLRSDLALSRSEASTLRVELSQAREEIARLKVEASQSHKLDDILALLKERPLQVSADSNVGIGPQHLVADDYVPMFIPSQIKSDANESRVAIQEESTSSSALSDASKALREKRKKQ
jgi:hypothetical protein